MSDSEINEGLANGARFVQFEYAISGVLFSIKRGSEIYFVPADEKPAKYGWKYTVLTLLVGWWGIPWGPIYTIQAVSRNLKGGHDVTQKVINHFNTRT